MFSRNLEATLHRALYIANKYQHEYTTFEHMLLSLLEDSDAIELLEHYKIDIKLLSSKLDKYLRTELGALVNVAEAEIKPTTGFQRVVHRAAIHGSSTGLSFVTGAHLLAEFFFEHEAFALRALKEMNLTRPQILHYLKKHEAAIRVHTAHNNSELFVKQPVDATQLAEPKIKTKENHELAQQEHPDALSEYCLNLTQKARDGTLDLLIGRDEEITRTIEILCRRQKNNPLLVGEPGVGKTAIAEGLALRIVNHEVPKWLQEHEIYSLDLTGLVAGTKYRGDFEERIQKLLAELKEQPKSILFIDEIHMLVGTGKTASSPMDASNLFKPALARGEIRCIGATTFKEYHNYFEQDAALTRRFQKIVIDEPSEAETIKILYGLKAYYEKHHGISYSDEALESIVQLSERYLQERYLPDKAIDLLDEAGARKKITNSIDRIVTTEDIENTVALIANLPPIVIADDDRNRIKILEHNLKKHIFGQEHAIEQVCTSIKLAQAGLSAPYKPIASYLFLGPSGVGKTEFAKQLAHFSGRKMLRFDMSEYAESHAISRLIGPPPGYIGFDRGGALTEAVSKQPYCVILFDELEKAHPEVYNLFLQVLDEGNLTDNTGKSVDFTHSIIIFTSNAGANIVHKKRSIGFEQNEKTKQEVDMNIVESIFPEEFRDRLDGIIEFNNLNVFITEQIIHKSLNILSAQLADKKVKLNIDQSLTEYLHILVQNNLNKGVRAIDRIIENQIKRKCAEEILFGSLKEGGTLNISFASGEVLFTAEAIV